MKQVIHLKENVKKYVKENKKKSAILTTISGLALFLALSKGVSWEWSNTWEKSIEMDKETIELVEDLKENYEILRPKWDEYKDKQMMVDYSHHQDPENLDPEKQELSPWLFIAKATESDMAKWAYGSAIDESFLQLRERNTNKPIGWYMFLNWWDDDIEDQCKLYIQTVSLKKWDFRPIIDIENCGRQKISHKNYKSVLVKLQKAIKILEEHYGVAPIIYTAERVYKDFLRWNLTPDTPIWVANYNGIRDKSLTEIDIWQCSQYSKVDIYTKGNHHTDVNVILDDTHLFIDHDVETKDYGVVYNSDKKQEKTKEIAHNKTIEENHNKKLHAPHKNIISGPIRSFSYKENNNTYTIYEYTFKSNRSEIGAAKRRVQEKAGKHIALSALIPVRKVGNKWIPVPENLIKDEYNQGNNVHFRIKK